MPAFARNGHYLVVSLDPHPTVGSPDRPAPFVCTVRLRRMRLNRNLFLNRLRPRTIPLKLFRRGRRACSSRRSPPAPAGQAPGLQAPKPAAEAGPRAREDVIRSIEFQGVQASPTKTLLARPLIFTKKGDKLDDESIHRDFSALWNTGRWANVRVEPRDGENRLDSAAPPWPQGCADPLSIPPDGNKSVTNSEILDRFKERKVGLSVESQYDPNKIQRARNVLQEYLAERGRQFATVEPELRQVPPSSLEVIFKVNEGPKVKVGELTFKGNEVMLIEDAGAP